MITLVLYDIQDNRIRRKVAETLKDYGMRRTQFSAFLGQLSHNRRQELMLVLSDLIADENGNIQIYTLTQRDLDLMVEIDPTGYAARAYM